MSQSNIIKYVQKRIIDKIYNYQMKNIWLNNKCIPMTFSLFFSHLSIFTYHRDV